MKLGASILVLLSFVAAACQGPLVVASDLDNPPFAGVDAAGNAVGRDVEMMEALAARMDRQLRWERLPFDELLDAVEAGEVDAVCATLGRTPERVERVPFTRPYFETSIAVVVRMGMAEPKSFGELAGRPVAGAVGTTSERAIRRRLPDAVFSPTTKDGVTSADRLRSGEVDALVMDGPAADALVASSDGDFFRLPEPLDREAYAIALRGDDPDLVQALDAALSTMLDDGTIAALDAAHGLAPDVE